MRTRTLAAAATVTVWPLVVAAPAAGQQQQLRVSVLPMSAQPGDEVLGTLTGCAPAQPAQIALAVGPGGVVEQGNADADGTLRAALPVPGNAEPGEAAVVGQCQGEGGATDATAETTLTIVAGTPGGAGVAGRGELPFTGARDVVPEAIVGVALTALGAALLLAGRRRNGST